MAKQDGFHPVIGTLGKTTFYRTKDGYFAREKTSIAPGRILTDPAFKRQQDNMSEFSRAGKAGKLIRNTLNDVLKTAADKQIIRRMTTALMQVVKSDPVSSRGLRKVQNGNLQILKDFEFNGNSLLSGILKAPYSTVVDRATGILTVDFPSFIPDASIKAPVGTTHFQLIAAAGEFDFENEKGNSDVKTGNPILLNKTATGPLSFMLNVTPGSVHTLFLICGIAYYEEVNGEMHQQTSGAYNALKILDVNTI